MKTIHMLDEKDVREEVNDTLSCAYEGRDWCEDGSVRQDIKGLKLKVDNNLSVLARHSIELSELALDIGKQNKKIDVLIESIADIDSLETLKKKLDVLNIKGDNGWMQN